MFQEMAKGKEERCVFPLTSLQIGDLQSYLSHRHLFLASETENFYILVDNRPWLKDHASLSTHWWQLMVTKSRLSPFANTRGGKKERKMTEELSESRASSSPYSRRLRNLREWFSTIDVVLVSRKSALLPVKKLTNSLIANSTIHRTLYGFIVFEVAWSNIRGINYHNELQTDTSLAIEAKIMRRWEFDSIAQAIRSISSWFPGTMKEQIILKKHLDATLGKVYYDAPESFQMTIDVNGNNTTNDVTGAGNESPYSPGHTPSVCPKTTGVIKNIEHTIHTTDGPTTTDVTGAEIESLYSPGHSPSVFPETTGVIKNKEQTIHTTDGPTTTDVTCAGNDSPCSQGHTPSVCPETTGIIKNREHTIHTTDGPTTIDVTCAGNESPYSPGHTPSVCPETTGIINNREHTFHTPDGPFQRKKVEREHKICSGEANNELVEVCSKTSDVSDSEERIEATIYSDCLILFRFNDPYLPFKLKDIIMSKLWLLTLLEAGLPSWVIFLQSYPGFCRLYRPWMCPLARGLYVLISVVTVLIGFYDLYKNVPLLKATVSKMFGPLFDWIDAWEMTSRIQYLGTMLFLHNFQKAMRWFLTATRTVLSILSFVCTPLTRPFLESLELFFPLWNMFIPVAQDFFSVIWTVVESSFTTIGDILEIFLLPLWYIVTVAWNFATSFVYPVAWILLSAPFKLLFGFFSIISSSCTLTYFMLRDVWMSARSIFWVTKGVQSTVSTVEISMWRSLWHDLFSQIFRALRVILNGLVAFLAACNRHRLSIYNRVGEFTKRSLRDPWSMRREKTRHMHAD